LRIPDADDLFEQAPGKPDPQEFLGVADTPTAFPPPVREAERTIEAQTPELPAPWRVVEPPAFDGLDLDALDTLLVDGADAEAGVEVPHVLSVVEPEPAEPPVVEQAESAAEPIEPAFQLVPPPVGVVHDALTDDSLPNAQQRSTDSAQIDLLRMVEETVGGPAAEAAPHEGAVQAEAPEPSDKTELPPDSMEAMLHSLVADFRQLADEWGNT
jgi:hypothetical protein